MTAFLKAMNLIDARELAELLGKHPDDAWMAKMVASSGAKKLGTILSSAGEGFFGTFSETRVATIRMLVGAAMADAEPDDVKALASDALSHRIIVGPAARIKDIEQGYYAIGIEALAGYR